MRIKKNCAKCGKSFKGTPQENYCPACHLEMSLYKKNHAEVIKKQNEVMTYIRDNQFKGNGITGQDVMKNLGVSREFLTGMIRQNFFESGTIKRGIKYPHPCAKCGITIEVGVYCKDCMSILKREAKLVGERNDLKKKILLEEELQRLNNSMILIVDENNRSADRTKQLLRDAMKEYRIVTATNLERALNVIHSMKVKMVLLDDAITEKYDGLKILRAVREDFRISDTPIIMTTTKFDEKKRNLEMQLNARDYLEKPVDKDYLVDRVQKAFHYDATFKEDLLKFLLIDDDEDDAQIEKNILEEKFKCTVFTADSGVEGLSILQGAEKIDLVFISLKMSFMDGFRVLAFIRQNEYFKDFPIIFLSDTEDPEIVELIKNSSAVGFINKPKFSADSINFIGKILRKVR